MNPFVIGQVYRRREELHELYGGQRQGGISTPRDYPYIFLFTGDQGNQYGYYDDFRDDGTFWYTGEGQIGDMVMERGNLAIFRHQAIGKELHLFRYVDSGLVRYEGRASYVAHHQEVVADRNGNPRRAIVFHLDIEPSEQGVADLQPHGMSREPRNLWRRPLSELRQLAIQGSIESQLASVRKSISYYRSEAIKVYVLRRASGVCEGCNSPAPFTKPDGEPYLEPHHIRRVADAGPDHPSWVIALCPNCHRRVHHGADGHDYNAALAARVAELERDTQ